MRQKKPGYRALLALTVLLTLAALVTVMPNAAASKPSLLGYKSICSFAPVATVVLLIAAGLVCVIRRRLFTAPDQPPAVTGTDGQA